MGDYEESEDFLLGLDPGSPSSLVDVDEDALLGAPSPAPSADGDDSIEAGAVASGTTNVGTSYSQDQISGTSDDEDFLEVELPENEIFDDHLLEGDHREKPVSVTKVGVQQAVQSVSEGTARNISSAKIEAGFEKKGAIDVAGHGINEDHVPNNLHVSQLTKPSVQNIGSIGITVTIAAKPEQTKRKHPPIMFPSNKTTNAATFNGAFAHAKPTVNTANLHSLTPEVHRMPKSYQPRGKTDWHQHYVSPKKDTPKKMFLNPRFQQNKAIPKVDAPNFENQMLIPYTQYPPMVNDQQQIPPHHMIVEIPSNTAYTNISNTNYYDEDAYKAGLTYPEPPMYHPHVYLEQPVFLPANAYPTPMTTPIYHAQPQSGILINQHPDIQQHYYSANFEPTMDYQNAPVHNMNIDGDLNHSNPPVPTWELYQGEPMKRNLKRRNFTQVPSFDAAVKVKKVESNSNLRVIETVDLESATDGHTMEAKVAHQIHLKINKSEYSSLMTKNDQEDDPEMQTYLKKIEVQQAERKAIQELKMKRRQMVAIANKKNIQKLTSQSGFQSEDSDQSSEQHYALPQHVQEQMVTGEHPLVQQQPHGIPEDIASHGKFPPFPTPNEQMQVPRSTCPQKQPPGNFHPPRMIRRNQVLRSTCPQQPPANLHPSRVTLSRNQVPRAACPHGQPAVKHNQSRMTHGKESGPIIIPVQTSVVFPTPKVQVRMQQDPVAPGYGAALPRPPKPTCPQRHPGNTPGLNQGQHVFRPVANQTVRVAVATRLPCNPSSRLQSPRVIGPAAVLQPIDIAMSPMSMVTLEPKDAGKWQKRVLIQNLSNNTTSLQIKNLCKNYGTVENLELKLSEKKGIVTFESSSSAVMFISQCQRKMINLSYITLSYLDG